MKRLGVKKLSSNEIKIKKLKTFVKKITRGSIFHSPSHGDFICLTKNSKSVALPLDERLVPEGGKISFHGLIRNQ